MNSTLAWPGRESWTRHWRHRPSVEFYPACRGARTWKFPGFQPEYRIGSEVLQALSKAEGSADRACQFSKSGWNGS